MKTVQETLKTINEKTLIDNYLHQNPPSFNDFDEKITIGDAKKNTLIFKCISILII